MAEPENIENRVTALEADNETRREIVSGALVRRAIELFLERNGGDRD